MAIEGPGRILLADDDDGVAQLLQRWLIRSGHQVDHAADGQQALALLELCGQLGAQVVAEGVETAGEADALAALGCDLMQGYHFARPGLPLPAVGWPA